MEQTSSNIRKIHSFRRPARIPALTIDFTWTKSDRMAIFHARHDVDLLDITCPVRWRHRMIHITCQDRLWTKLVRKPIDEEIGSSKNQNLFKLLRISSSVLNSSWQKENIRGTEELKGYGFFVRCFFEIPAIFLFLEFVWFVGIEGWTPSLQILITFCENNG